MSDIFWGSAVIIFTMVVALSILWPARIGAPWIATTHTKVRRILELAEVKPADTVYDLGCGDGRVLLMAARRFGARAVGIEIDPLRYAWSKLIMRVFGVQDQVKVIWGNLFAEDLSSADVVVVYLLQHSNIKLMRKLWDELAPGTRVVSNVFIFPGWEVVHIDKEYHLYLYRIKPNQV